MLWGISVHFCLDYQATVLYIERGYDLDIYCGVGWGLPHPELLDGSGYFGGSWRQEETAGGDHEHQRFPAEVLHYVVS